VNRHHRHGANVIGMVRMSFFMLISWAHRAMAAHDRKGGGDVASRTSGLGENLFNSSCPKCSPPGAWQARAALVVAPEGAILD
jgi:hypothetical protein